SPDPDGKHCSRPAEVGPGTELASGSLADAHLPPSFPIGPLDTPDRAERKPRLLSATPAKRSPAQSSVQRTRPRRFPGQLHARADIGQADWRGRSSADK